MANAASKAGVDGRVEVGRALDQLAAVNELAASAPRGTGLYRFLADAHSRGGRHAELAHALSEQLIRRLGIWWSPAVYARMPVLTPWCVRDRSCRYDQGPESWGAPLPTGEFRDDNSIIKKLPLPLEISAPENHPYAGRRAWRGFTACHVWRELPDETVAGADAWLYSFVPNLVWLPSPLAPLSDREGSPVQQLLQRMSLSLYRDAPVAEPVSGYATRAWSRLPHQSQSPAEDVRELARFVPTEAFFRRRLAYIAQVARACDDVQGGRPLTEKLISSRYTAGLPEVEGAELQTFAAGLKSYASAVTAALTPAERTA